MDGILSTAIGNVIRLVVGHRAINENIYLIALERTKEFKYWSLLSGIPGNRILSELDPAIKEDVL